jgi:hypothetical protein
MRILQGIGRPLEVTRHVKDVIRRALTAVFEEGLHLQPLMACGEKEPKQTAAQDRDADEQFFLKEPERRIRCYAKPHHVVKGAIGIATNRLDRHWTIECRLVNLNLHGADSEPRYGNGKDMLHAFFQLRRNTLMLQKRPEFVRTTAICL